MIVRVRRKHRWWKRQLRLTGGMTIGLIVLTAALALGIAGLVVLAAK